MKTELKSEVLKNISTIDKLPLKCRHIQAQFKLTARRILKTSQNEEIRTLYNLTSSRNVKSDFMLKSTRVSENRQVKQNSTKVTGQFGQMVECSFMN